MICLYLQPLAHVVAHVKEGYRMEPPDYCPEEIYDCMEEAWELDPNKRPTFKEVAVRLEKIKNSMVQPELSSHGMLLERNVKF